MSGHGNRAGDADRAPAALLQAAALLSILSILAIGWFLGQRQAAAGGAPPPVQTVLLIAAVGLLVFAEPLAGRLAGRLRTSGSSASPRLMARVAAAACYEGAAILGLVVTILGGSPAWGSLPGVAAAAALVVTWPRR